MYDKFGRILRVETVINRPQEFSVYRTRFHRDGTASRGFFPMNKEVANLVHYQSRPWPLTAVTSTPWRWWTIPPRLTKSSASLTEPKIGAGRSFAGFNPAHRGDVRLFAAVLDDDHIARGFRNKDIRAALYGSDVPPSPRLSASVGRLLKRLHVRQLVAKIPHTRRWRITISGRQLLSRAVQLYRQSWPELLAA